MKFVDFAAADAHKWLLGPLGTAIFYVREEHFDRLHPPLVGWNSASSPNFIAQKSLTFKRDARRYEPGSLNLCGVVGLRAALQLLFDYGIESIESHVLALAKQAIASGMKAGFSVLGPTKGARDYRGSFHAFSGRSKIWGSLHAKLEAAQIITSLRYCRDGRRCLRLSPHFYNRDEAIAGLFVQI